MTVCSTSKYTTMIQFSASLLVLLLVVRESSSFCSPCRPFAVGVRLASSTPTTLYSDEAPATEELASSEEEEEEKEAPPESTLSNETQETKQEEESDNDDDDDADESSTRSYKRERHTVFIGNLPFGTYVCECVFVYYLHVFIRLSYLLFTFHLQKQPRMKSKSCAPSMVPSSSLVFLA